MPKIVGVVAIFSILLLLSSKTTWLFLSNRQVSVGGTSLVIHVHSHLLTTHTHTHTVVTSELTASPSYMQALLVSTEEQEEANDDHTPQDPPGDVDLLQSQERSEQTETNNSDSYENPFLKPAKQVKITLLNRSTQ